MSVIYKLLRIKPPKEREKLSDGPSKDHYTAEIPEDDPR